MYLPSKPLSSDSLVTRPRTSDLPSTHLREKKTAGDRTTLDETSTLTKGIGAFSTIQWLASNSPSDQLLTFDSPTWRRRQAESRPTRMSLHHKGLPSVLTVLSPRWEPVLPSQSLAGWMTSSLTLPEATQRNLQGIHQHEEIHRFLMGIVSYIKRC